MINNLLEKLVEKSITKEELKKKVKKDFDMLPEILNGLNSDKAPIRYGCGKVLMDLSEENPEKLYPYYAFFVEMLDSKYRIITWQAMAIIANLTKVDIGNKFEEIFDKYYNFLNDEYMVTVANVVGHSGKIAQFKPHMANKISEQLLKINDIKINPHLTPECKKVIAEKAILYFDMFFKQIDNKDEVILFLKKHFNSPRKTLKNKAEKFLNKWNKL